MFRTCFSVLKSIITGPDLVPGAPQFLHWIGIEMFKNPDEPTVLLRWSHRPLNCVQVRLCTSCCSCSVHGINEAKEEDWQCFAWTTSYDPEPAAVITTRAQKLLERFNLTYFHCSNKQSGWCQMQKMQLNNRSITEGNIHDGVSWSERTRGPSLL